MTEDDIALAGELALGVLDGDERAAALRLVLSDPAFAAEVERWRGRLGALGDEWPEAEPGPAVARHVAAIGAPAGVSAAWRWLAGAASVAAAVLLVLLLARPAPRSVPASSVVAGTPLLVAVLAPEGGAPFAAVAEFGGRAVRLGGSPAVPAGRAAELWLIGADGVPHAAGLLAAARAGRLAVRPGVVLRAGGTLAISIEPAGGSPKPTPTGPVVATGVLVEVRRA